MSSLYHLYHKIWKMNFAKLTNTLSNDHEKLSTDQMQNLSFKGCSDPSHFIFEINCGKKRIRHSTLWSRSGNSLLNFNVVVCRIRLFPTLISKIKWLRCMYALLISSESSIWLIKNDSFAWSNKIRCQLWLQIFPTTMFQTRTFVLTF